MEEVYRELNQYRIKNSELNSEIKKIKDKNLDDDDEIGRLMEQLKSIEKENITLRELLKQNNNDLKNKIIVWNIIYIFFCNFFIFINKYIYIIYIIYI